MMTESQNATTDDNDAGNALSPADLWVDGHGDYLFDYAAMRLRDWAAAQDAVQETFLAALRGQHTYRGTAEERGWLLGILKHKIHDHFRKTTRQPCFTQLRLEHDEATGEFCAEGSKQGMWSPNLAPSAWPAQPGATLDNAAFWQAFYQCADKLPRQTARAFLLRELDDLDSEQICTLLEITQDNLWVLLHRARLSLRRCLEINWFTPLNA